MRTVILVGLIRIAYAINPISEEAQNAVAVVLVMALIMDVTEFLKDMLKDK